LLRAGYDGYVINVEALTRAPDRLGLADDSER
jgi:hypothetical protein